MGSSYLELPEHGPGASGSVHSVELVGPCFGSVLALECLSHLIAIKENYKEGETHNCSSITLISSHQADDDGHQARSGEDGCQSQGPGGVRHTDSCDW